MDQKILKLLQSAVLDDILIGLNILLDKYDKQGVIEFFETYGRGDTTNNVLLTSKSIETNYTKPKQIMWNYWYRGDIGFLLSHRLFLLKHRTDVGAAYINPTEI